MSAQAERIVFVLAALVISVATGVWAHGALGGMDPPMHALWRIVVTLGVSGFVLIVLRLTILSLSGGLRGNSGQNLGAGSASSPDVVRRWLAPAVVGIGTLGIFILTLAIILIIESQYEAPIAKDPQYAKDLHSAIAGVFTAVLPVFSTWVGTVLAFYFTNESFRQANQNRIDLAQATAPAHRELLWGSPRVIVFDKITGHTMTTATTDLMAARTQVDLSPLTDAQNAFAASQTITRYMIFDARHAAVYVLRKSRMPNPPPPNPTIGAYMAVPGNREDAQTFRHIGIDCTLDDARAEIARLGVRDLFITRSGLDTEPVLGWTSDDLMRP